MNEYLPQYLPQANLGKSQPVWPRIGFLIWHWSVIDWSHFWLLLSIYNRIFLFGIEITTNCLSINNKITSRNLLKHIFRRLYFKTILRMVTEKFFKHQNRFINGILKLTARGTSGISCHMILTYIYSRRPSQIIDWRRVNMGSLAKRVKVIPLIQDFYF